MFYSRKVHDLHFSFHMQEDYRDYYTLYVTSEPDLNFEVTFDFLTIPKIDEEEKNYLCKYYGEHFEIWVHEFFRDKIFLTKFGL